MAISRKIGWVLGLVMAVTFPGVAAEPPVKITAVPKTSEDQRRLGGDVAVGELLGLYKIIVKNPSFMAATPALTAKYRIFVRRDDGMKAPRDIKPERVSGELSVPVIKPGESAPCETASVKLRQTSLDPGFYYTNGKRGATRDELVGIWVRMFDGDHQVAEYLSSAALAKSGPF